MRRTIAILLAVMMILSTTVVWAYGGAWANCIKKSYYDDDGRLVRYYMYEYNTSGNLVKESLYRFSIITGNIELGEYYMYEYDTSGNLIKQSYYPSTHNFELDEYYMYEYDNSGNLIKQSLYDNHSYYANKLEWDKVYEYDNLGKLIKDNLHFDFKGYGNMSGKFDRYTVYEYDTSENLIKESLYNKYDELDECCMYEYDTSGNLIKESVYNEYDELDEYYMYEYDNSGNLIKESYYYRSGKLDHYFVYEYDQNDILEETELIVDQDPAADLVLPTDKLEKVEDSSDAVSAVKSAASTMTTEQKESATGVDKLTVFAEEAAANAATTEVASDINVTNDVVSGLVSKSDEANAKVEQAVVDSGVELNREVQQNVKIKTKSSVRKTVDFSNDLNLGNVDNVIIESEDYSVSIPAEVIAEEQGLQMTIEEAGEYTGSLDDSIIFAANAKGNKTFKISFNKNQLKSNVKVSLQAKSGDTNSQAIVNQDGKAIGGKYNPTTGMLEAKINTAGTYEVKVNSKDFSDITNKSAEMQEAIKTLAAKGIISGTSETTFSPDKSISRAEIAAIILRTLGKVDANADGKFTDVKKSDWYYGTAGSSKKYGIISGYPDGTFRGNTTIVKEQVIAVSARTLQQEMGYKTPADTSKYLGKYADSAKISDWAKGTTALATRENLVIQRTDSKFVPQENITRGEAALILKKLFDRVW